METKKSAGYRLRENIYLKAKNELKELAKITLSQSPRKSMEYFSNQEDQ